MKTVVFSSLFQKICVWESSDLTVIDVPDDRRRFEMSLDGVHIHIEYEDESVLRKAIKGLSHVFSV